MLFTSIAYAIFLPVVLLLYFALPNRWRWALLLAASYLFYMWWRADFALLIMVGSSPGKSAGITHPHNLSA
ncbi:hypothetical protein ACFL59_12185, partial [Planctomycetota bacterium]